MKEWKNEGMKNEIIKNDNEIISIEEEIIKN